MISDEELYQQDPVAFEALMRVNMTPGEIEDEVLDHLASAICAAERLTDGDTDLAFEVVSRSLWKHFRPPAVKPRPGRITRRMRRKIFERDEHTCAECPATKNLTIDHIIPISKGGLTVEENLRLLCGPCNSSKRDR